MLVSAVKDEKTKVYESVVASLLTLRTFKRIKENFPEAYRHIACYEDKGKTSVSLPIDNIMDTLKKYDVGQCVQLSCFLHNNKFCLTFK